MGSVASGGRYDDLTGTFGLKNVPGVGMSFGMERIYDVMEQLSLFPEIKSSSVKVLFANMGEEEAKAAFKLTQQLRDAGISADLYPENAKLGKQFKFADKNEIPFVLVAGSDELEKGVYSLKDLKSGEQELLSVHEIIEKLR